MNNYFFGNLEGVGHYITSRNNVFIPKIKFYYPLFIKKQIGLDSLELEVQDISVSNSIKYYVQAFLAENKIRIMIPSYTYTFRTATISYEIAVKDKIFVLDLNFEDYEQNLMDLDEVIDEGIKAELEKDIKKMLKNKYTKEFSLKTKEEPEISIKSRYKLNS